MTTGAPGHRNRVYLHQPWADASKDKQAYLAQPAVWKDIRSVCERCLSLYPDDVRPRSFYAYMATQCGRWSEADRQFKVLGESPALEVFGSMTSYNYLRKKAARLTQAATQPVQQ